MSSFETLSFVRGTSTRYPIDQPSLQVPRKDRRPLHTKANFHKIANEWFFSKFGVSYRSEAIFLTSQINIAVTYAKSRDHVLRVIPIGEYKYCWSPSVTDLFLESIEYEDKTDTQIRQFLDSSCYQETSLSEAWKTGNEVMLVCDRYVAIPIRLLEPNIDNELQKIVNSDNKIDVCTNG